MLEGPSTRSDARRGVFGPAACRWLGVYAAIVAVVEAVARTPAETTSAQAVTMGRRS